MNIRQLTKNPWQTRVRFFPVVQRYDGGPGGVLLPFEDREWIIGQRMPGGVQMYQVEVPYVFTLGFDQIKEFMSQPERGEHRGVLMLKVQVNTGGNRVWTEPLMR